MLCSLEMSDSRGTPSVNEFRPVVTQDMFNGKDAANARYLMEALYIQFLTIHYSRWTHVKLRTVNDFQALPIHVEYSLRAKGLSGNRSIEE